MAKAPSRQEGWKHSFAGGVAGSVAVMALHPFDVIKTRLQVQDGHQAQSATYRGAIDAARVMYRREGWRAFYNGLTPSWVGSGVAWAAYFYAYERIKGMYLGWTGGERLGTLWNTLSAAQAGAMVCLITNPIWLIKTRLQLQQQPKPPSSMLPSPAAAAAAVPGSGVGSVGTAPRTQSAAAAGGSPSTGGQQPPRVPGPATSPSPLSSQAVARAAAGESVPAAAAALRPSPVQQPPPGAAAAAAAGSRQAAAHTPYRGMLDALVRIGKEEGVRGYYKGLGPSLVLQTCHGAIQFTVYEELKHLFGALPLTWTTRGAAPATAHRTPPSSAPSSSPAAAAAGAGDALDPLPLASPSPSSVDTSTSSTQPEGQQPPVPSPRQLSSLETSVCAVLSKLGASVITYPSQVVRSRLQQRFDDRNLVYKGSIETVVLTWRHEGLRGFYRGLGPALMRTLPQSALTLTLYEKVLQYLPASSS